MKLKVFGWGRFGLCVLGGVCIGVVVGGILWPPIPSIGPPSVMFLLGLAIGVLCGFGGVVGYLCAPTPKIVTVNR